VGLARKKMRKYKKIERLPRRFLNRRALSTAKRQAD
jgi:hypothetical protein